MAREIRVGLLRHGESIWNLENKFTGWADVDLSDHGTWEAQRASNLLRAERLAGLGELAMNFWWSWHTPRLCGGNEGIHKSNAPRFSARRMVKEYISKFYVTALRNAEEAR